LEKPALVSTANLGNSQIFLATRFRPRLVSPRGNPAASSMNLDVQAPAWAAPEFLGLERFAVDMAGSSMDEIICDGMTAVCVE
jgi:hypothetical protein